MRNDVFRALQERSFAYLWIGEIFAQISINLFNFFLILIVFKMTHSNTAVAGIVISFTIPAIIFGSLAGAFVDRWNKKIVLLSTDLIRAILLVLLALLVHHLAAIYIISFLVAIVSQFFIPAETPIIPLLVKPKHLYSANALFGIALYGSILVAYVLSGPVILFFGDVTTLVLLAVSMLLGALFISFIRTSHMKNQKTVSELKVDKSTILSDIKRTVALLSKTKILYRSLFLLALSQIIILIVATIAPGYATTVLKIKVEEFPLLFVAPAALGVLVGALGLINFFHKVAKEKLATIGVFMSGIAVLLLPFGSRVASREFIHDINAFLPRLLWINSIHIMVVLALILGIANALVFVPSNTLVQEETNDEVRGKVYGVLNSAVGIFSLLPIIIVGGLSDLIGVSAVITGLGVILLCFGGVRLLIK